MSLVLVLPLIASLLGVCRGLDGEPFIGYTEEPYLTQWASETFTNFPGPWWLTGIYDNVCPGPQSPGFSPGVRCSRINGNDYVTDIDLGQKSLAPYGVVLNGQLKSPPYIVGLYYLSSLNLHGNELNGTLPETLRFAPRLKRLILSNNSLSGAIPGRLCSLNLTCLNLSYNNFTGRIPDCFKNKPCVDFAGNRYLNITPGSCVNDTQFSSCDTQIQIVETPPSPPGSSLPVGAIVGGVVGGLVLCALVAIGVLLYLRHRKILLEKQQRELHCQQIESELSSRRFGPLKRFSPEEVSGCCNNFGDDNYLGEGAFSVVYKGCLEDSTTVAVKKVKDERLSQSGQLAFINEIEIISQASHKNLAHCLGFCADPETKTFCLILQYYGNGSVSSRTRGKEGAVLTAEARRRVAKGTAEGLAYLHSSCQPPIIHRDIKAENILLGEDEEAVVADFGLATEMEDTQRETQVKGTLGYIAPEYFMSGKCSVKTDVYAFGMFLVELVTGKNVFELLPSDNDGQLDVHSWLRTQLETEAAALKLVDGDIRMTIVRGSESDLIDLLELAALCVNSDPDQRPTMVQVASMIQLDGKSLTSRWAQWQQEAAVLTGEQIMGDLTLPSVWDNNTTGVVLDPSTLKGKAR